MALYVMFMTVIDPKHRIIGRFMKLASRSFHLFTFQLYQAELNLRIIIADNTWG